MIMKLLALLGKLLGEIRRQMRVHPDEELLNDKQLNMLETITREYRQLRITSRVAILVRASRIE